MDSPSLLQSRAWLWTWATGRKEVEDPPTAVFSSSSDPAAFWLGDLSKQMKLLLPQYFPLYIGHDDRSAHLNQWV